MPLNETSVVARAQRLLSCTNDAANFSDKMDIIFVAEMIEKIGKFVERFNVSTAINWSHYQTQKRSTFCKLTLTVESNACVAPFKDK